MDGMRHSSLHWLALLLLVLVPSLLRAAPPERAAGGADIVVFVRAGCPHCAEAKAFLEQLQARRPELRIELRAVDADPAARDQLQRLSRQAGHWPPGVPAFLVGGQLLVGFSGAQHTGDQLLAMLDSGVPAAAAAPLPFAGLSVERLGLPLFTLALGLLDGFNPCAMWVLLFLLSLLVHMRDRRRMAAVAGCFVLVSGAVYYAFMAAWLNLFLLVGFSGLAGVLLGLLALAMGALNLRDGLRSGQPFALSIPAAAKPSLYARVRGILAARALLPAAAGAAGLAVVVNFVELLCTAGLPALYTAVLAQQELSRAAYHAYLGLYILGYVADDALMVASAVAALSSRRLSERAGRRLKLISGAVMLALGGVMLLRPEWLAPG